MKITKLYSAAVVVMAALTFASCSNKKFHINGNITEAKDSMLYLENISLDGPVAIDSVKLGEDGSFAFEETAKDSVCPDFYRLRIAGQTINPLHRLHRNHQREGCVPKYELPVHSGRF